MIDAHGTLIFERDPSEADSLDEFVRIIEGQIPESQRLTDIHLDTLGPTWVMINDHLYPTNATPVPQIITEDAKMHLSTHAQHLFDTEQDAGGRLKRADGSIIRMQLYMCDDSISLALRLQPPRPWTFDQMGIPDHLLDLLERPQGLVLFAGAVGSRKTSVLHAMLDTVNRRSEKQRKHIYMIDDPPEFTHLPLHALFHGREIGVTTPNYKTAIYGSLRAKPDYLTIGEMRNAETIEAAVLAGSLGRLVMTTIHSETATQTLTRLIQSFPADRRDEMNAALADVLLAICAFKVVPTVSGGTALAYEILRKNDQTRNLLDDPVQLRGALDDPGCADMNSFETCLSEMYRKSIITRESAEKYAPDPSRLTLDSSQR